MHVVRLGDLDGLVQIVGVIEHETKEGGGGHVGFIGILVRGRDLALGTLVGHVDATAHAGVVHAVERRVDGSQAGEAVLEAVDLGLGVHAQQAQVDRGDRGVAVAEAEVCTMAACVVCIS